MSQVHITTALGNVFLAFTRCDAEGCVAVKHPEQRWPEVGWSMDRLRDEDFCSRHMHAPSKKRFAVTHV